MSKLRVFCVNFLPWNLRSCKSFDKFQVWSHYLNNLISTMLWLTSAFKNNFRQFFGDPIECDAGAVRSFFRLSFPHHRSEMYVCTYIEVTNCEKWKSQFFRISWKLYFIGQANAAVEQDVLDSYCWMYSTWNVPRWFTMMLSSNNYCLMNRES